MATLSSLLGQNFPNGTFANDVTFQSTGFVRLPNGTTAQRPLTASSGMFRFNTETNEFEGYNGTAWGSIGGDGGLFSETSAGVWESPTITTATINGDLIVTGDVTSTSDQRLKDNIVTIADALNKVNALRGVEFDMNNSRHIGVIAQEVETVVPEVVITSNDDMETKSVAYGNIVGLLIEAIKEQSAKIEKLEQEMEELKNGI